MDRYTWKCFKEYVRFRKNIEADRICEYVFALPHDSLLMRNYIACRDILKCRTRWSFKRLYNKDIYVQMIYAKYAKSRPISKTP